MNWIRLVCFTTLPALIGPKLAIVGLLGACGVLCFARNPRVWWLVGSLIVCAQLTRLNADVQSMWPVHNAGQLVWVAGRLDSPRYTRGQGYATLRIDRADVRGLVGRKIWLGWSAQRWQPIAGEHWRLQVRMKSIGVAPTLKGDPLAQLLAKGIVGKGRLAPPDPQWLGPPPASAQARQFIESKIQVIPGLHRDLARAILLGHRPDWDQIRWAAIEQSGLAHLFSPSGLHLGMAVG